MRPEPIAPKSIGLSFIESRLTRWIRAKPPRRGSADSNDHAVVSPEGRTNDPDLGMACSVASPCGHPKEEAASAARLHS